MLVLCQCQGWCQCWYYIDVNLIISSTAWLKLNLKIIQHKVKFFQHSRVYRFIMGDLTTLSIDCLKILLYFLLWPYSPQQKALNSQQYNPRTHLSLHCILLSDDWFSLGLFFCTAQHAAWIKNTSTLKLIVDQWIYGRKTCSNLSRKNSFPGVLGITVMIFSAMLWVRVSCHASNKKSYWLARESL